MEKAEIIDKYKAISEEKAKHLSEVLNTRVTPFLFIHENEPVYGYLKEPARLDKMRAIDLYEISKTQAGDHIVRTSLIREESDHRILEEGYKNDEIYLGAIDFACKMVVWHSEQLKKK
jgi:hypothetical protein